MLTIRTNNPSLSAYKGRLSILLTELKKLNLIPSKVQSEVTVYDDNEDHDSAWISFPVSNNNIIINDIPDILTPA